jgi:hypothetical protein
MTPTMACLRARIIGDCKRTPGMDHVRIDAQDAARLRVAGRSDVDIAHALRNAANGGLARVVVRQFTKEDNVVVQDQRIEHKCPGPVLGVFAGEDGVRQGKVLGAFLHELTLDTDQRYVPKKKGEIDDSRFHAAIMYNVHLTPRDRALGHLPLMANGGKFVSVLGFVNSHRGLGQRNAVKVWVLINNMPVIVLVARVDIPAGAQILM